MTPSRAYLMRALNEWILDNQCTPYLVVDATKEAVKVPEQYVSNGQIVLNINPQAVKNLDITNEYVRFEARFGGQPHLIYLPMDAVAAIYAKENGRGMVFGWEVEPAESSATAQSSDGQTAPLEAKDFAKSGKPQLKIIK